MLAVLLKVSFELSNGQAFVLELEDDDDRT